MFDDNLKDKIQKAKEYLGDNASILIADILDIQEYDKEKRRGLCPVHSENTPSFIWYPEGKCFKCFGCQANIDILDAYMMTGKSFTEAAQEVLKMCDITHSFGTHKIKTKREYRYPKPIENKNLDNIINYLNLRGISEKTARYLNIQDDGKSNLVFNYYDTNDVLTMVKYRPARKIKKPEPKNWVQKNSDSTPLLFNMNRINIDAPLIITCGELDCATVIECGFLNAVSIPLGDGNTHWITENWDWLEQFNEIVICHDNDEAGIKFIKNVVHRLGSWRCKIVDVPEYFVNKKGNKIPIKDINEVLFCFGREKVIEIIGNAKDTPVPSVVKFGDIAEIDLTTRDGFSTGFKEIDNKLLKFYYGDLTLLTGKAGSGKTSFLSQIIAQAADQNVSTWIYSKELQTGNTKSWINYVLAGRRNVIGKATNVGKKYWIVDNVAKSKINKCYFDNIFVYKDEYSNYMDEILNSMEDTCRKYGSKLFILDNLMTIDIGSGENKNELETAFINRLIQFAQRYNVHIILVVHLRKSMYGQETTMDDVAGSSNIVNLAHRSLNLRRVSKSEKEGKLNRNRDGYEVEPIKHDVILTVLKDRITGMLGAEAGFYYDVPSKRFYSNPEEFDYKFKWDTNEYTYPLEYPPDKKDEDVFGTIKK